MKRDEHIRRLRREARHKAAIDRALRSDRGFEERAADIVSELYPRQSGDAVELHDRQRCIAGLTTVLSKNRPKTAGDLAATLLRATAQDTDLDKDLSRLLARMFLMMRGHWPVSVQPGFLASLETRFVDTGSRAFPIRETAR